MNMAGARPFAEALLELGRRRLMPTTMSAAELRGLDAAVRRQSFFSARTALTEVLAAYQRDLAGLLSPRTEQRMREDGTVESFTAGMDPATVRLRVKEVLERLGYQPEADKRGTIQDLSSNPRINLVIETNLQMAQGYGFKRQGQEVIAAFPAWELYRLEERREKRDWRERWRLAGQQSGRALNDGWTLTSDGRMVALKNHPIWEALGSSALFDDGLDNSYPPFAFNSGMWVEEVSRSATEALGLLAPGQNAAAEAVVFATAEDAWLW